MKKRADTYLGTYDYQDAGGMLELETIRDSVKAINKLAANKDKWAAIRALYHGTTFTKSPRYYVKLQGRFGKNNPNMSKYTRVRRDGSTYVNYQICRLADASHVDAYVYERR